MTTASAPSCPPVESRAQAEALGAWWASLVLLVLFVSAPLAGCAKKAAFDGRAPRAGMPALDLAERPVPEEQQYDPMFSQVSLHGRTYTLPCPVQELVDDGWWVVSKTMTVGTGDDRVVLDDFDTVGGYDSAETRLLDEEGNYLVLGVHNRGPDPVALADALVVRMEIYARTVEPYPGIRAGVPQADAERILGEADDEQREYLVYFRDPLAGEQVADLVGEYDPEHEYGYTLRRHREMTTGSVRISLDDGVLSGVYEITLPFHVTGTCHAQDTTVVCDTTVVYDTIFLGITGLGTLTVHGHAQAEGTRTLDGQPR